MSNKALLSKLVEMVKNQVRWMYVNPERSSGVADNGRQIESWDHGMTWYYADVNTGPTDVPVLVELAPHYRQIVVRIEEVE